MKMHTFYKINCSCQLIVFFKSIFVFNFYFFNILFIF